MRSVMIFPLLAAMQAYVVCWEIGFERLPRPYQWLTRARYPRGFPLIVGFHVFIFLVLIILTVIALLAGW